METPSTGDKISVHTKELLNKRTRLKAKQPKFLNGNMEITELNKLIRKEMRKDLNKCDKETVRKASEENWSTKKEKKELSRGKSLLLKMAREAEEMYLAENSGPLLQ